MDLAHDKKWLGVSTICIQYEEERGTIARYIRACIGKRSVGIEIGGMSVPSSKINTSSIGEAQDDNR
jgi:hypothetical protein